MNVSIGSVIYTATGPWQVTACGNGRYTVKRVGGKGRAYTMVCAELHADLDSGSAYLAPSRFVAPEVTRSYKASCARDDRYLQAQVAA